MSSVSLAYKVFSRISHPIVIFIFAVLGILHCLLRMKDRKRKRLWFVILLFFFMSLIAAAVRVNNAPGFFKPLLIPVALMALFVPFGIDIAYSMLDRIVAAQEKKTLRWVWILAIAYMLVVNVMAANGYLKEAYFVYYFDEYYAASRIVKEHRGRKILIIEAPNAENFKVTRVYLDEKDDVYICPSSDSNTTKMTRILEENDFDMILRVKDPQNNISHMIKDFRANSITKNGVEIIYLDRPE
ncbi:MAG: hypothetical protein ACYS8Z_18185 [Planctomycetota bacterium]